MILKVRKSYELGWSDVTPEETYRSRREFIRTAAAGLIGAAAGTALAACDTSGTLEAQATLAATKNPKYATDTPNTYEQITSYNNFYEFGTGKGDPVRYAGSLTTSPWTVKVDGFVGKPGSYGVEDLVDFKALEERIYRHRCVEAWSMVIPWIGVPLASVLKKVEPTSKAKFVQFTTLVRPSEMPGQRSEVLEWPYVEGLRLDEAMNPLALMVVGLYGKVLPNQNGAPLRVHVPWKYGFKSGKSIVRISLTDQQPQNTWAVTSPNEYGFYANVNPDVPHPRWSQAYERRLPDFTKSTKTRLFNGYGEEVASLYAGMDLRKYF